jgi:hypothetical protein
MIFLPRKHLIRILIATLESACSYTHWAAIPEIWLTGRHCNLALFAIMLDEKHELGVWHD